MYPTVPLKEDPPEISTAAKNISPAMERLIRRCLEKSPEERVFSPAVAVDFAKPKSLFTADAEMY